MSFEAHQSPGLDPGERMPVMVERPRVEALRARALPDRLPFDSAVAVRPGALPEPLRGLLVHDAAMTSTLAAFHAAPIDLDVLCQDHSEHGMSRAVLLRRRTDGRAVAFGAIAVDLGVLPGAMRAAVLEGRVPFGRLLHAHAVPFSCMPHGYFRTDADETLARAFAIPRDTVLWGRRNRLLDGHDRPMADVVEVLHLP